MNRPRGRSRSAPAFLATAVVASIMPAVARAEFRRALVIGQSSYKTGPLAAPSRDVTQVSEALTKQGFTVTKAENLATGKDLDAAVKAFAKTVPTGGTALVYFSGLTVTLPNAAGTNPPRSDTALVALDGSPHPLGAVLRPLCVSVPGADGAFAFNASASGLPAVSGKPDVMCGSRINIVILDASTAAPPAVAAQGGPTAPVDLPPDVLVVFRPADAKSPAADAAGPSPLADRLASALASGKPLDAVLAGLSSRTASSLAEGELARLSGPASRAVSPPDTLAPGGRPGEEWVDRNGIVFCWCPPGEFTIGSPLTEPERQTTELQARVAFAEGFWIAKHELSAREAAPLGIALPAIAIKNKLQPFAKDGEVGPNLPAVFDAANAVAPSGWEYGLPTEAEWEYAARAGTTTAYSFGDKPADLPRFGNFADKALRESNAVGIVAAANPPRGEKNKSVFFGDRATGLFTYAHRDWNDSSVLIARVGSYPPNPWGLHDVHGNVSEVTLTMFNASRLGPVVQPAARKEWSARPENAKYPMGPVCKGGSWASAAGSCRSAARGWATVKEAIVGLRFVLRRKGSGVAPAATRWTPLVPSEFTATSGAKAKPDSDGILLVTGTVAAGDTYTLTCPVPAGLEPLAVRIETLADPSLPKDGPGRRQDGYYGIAEISIAGSRAGQKAAIDVLDVRSDVAGDSRSARPTAPSAALVDGRQDTVWSGVGGKPREVVFTIGLPSWTGQDAARWRYPVIGTGSGPLASLVVTIAHQADTPGPLGKFRLSVLHEEPPAAR